MPNDTRRAARHVRQQVPRTNRLLAVRRTRYTTRKRTRSWTPNLGGDIADIAGSIGSDWGGDRDDRKSIGAYISMVADALTKALPNPQYVTLTEMMGVYGRN